MRDLIRSTKSEFIKMRHTKLLWIHVLVPCAGAAAFLFYYTFAPWSAAARVQAYVETLAVAYPFLSALACSMSVELEEEGRMQTFLILCRKKRHAFLGKWLALNLCSLAASVLAVLGFAAGYTQMIGRSPYPPHCYFLSALLLWFGQTVLYTFYLFLSLRYAKAATVAAGIIGAVLAALMLTGLGDGCWPFIPCAWSGRWNSFLLLYETGDANRWSGLSGALPKELAVCAAAAILITSAIVLWFHYYEGRRCEE